MKTIKFTCDNSDCQNKTTNLKESNWLEIGSEKNSLFINNHFITKNLISMQNHGDLHFCSPDCFSDKFIDNENRFGKSALFTQNQIEQFQGQIYLISGEGEIMKLFNSFLGVNAG